MFKFVCAVAASVVAAAAISVSAAPRVVAIDAVPAKYSACVSKEKVLSGGWEFAKVDSAANVPSNAPAEALNWKSIRIPHDWAIYGPFIKNGDGATGKLPWKGAGWYRRTIYVESDSHLVFDGVMARSRVFIDGREAGGSDYGYVGFVVPVPVDVYGRGSHELLVKVDTFAHRSRWYPGAGIYRKVVQIEHSGKTWIVPDSVRIAPEPLEYGKPAKVDVSLEISDNGSEREEKFSFEIVDPKVWDIASPNLYELELFGLKYLFGLRTAEFTVDRGFFLNGRRVEIRGACLHSDLGILGMEFNKSAMRRQLCVLKEMGFNGVRTSHNAPAPELLDLCDEMGFVVWDECFDKWDDTAGREPEQNLEEYVAKYLRLFARRDRNHPSVVAWSIGNEIDSASQDAGKKDGTTRERCRLFREAIRSEDSSRPVAIASCAWYKSVVEGGDYLDLDLAGWNYSSRYAFYRGEVPSQPVIESESASCVSSSGFYMDGWPKTKYDFSKRERNVDGCGFLAPGWGDPPERDYERMANDTYCAGQFVWTGTDYLGENYPVCEGKGFGCMDLTPSETARSSYFGVCDLLHLPKDNFYNYRANWRGDVHTLQISPRHWTFPGRKGCVRPVQVFTDAPSAELFINGKSLGRRVKDPARKSYPQKFWGDDCEDPAGYFAVLKRYRLMWEDAVYEPGEITAVAYDGEGREIARQTLRTAGAAAKIRLEPESETLPPDRDELIFVKVSATDADGVLAPGDSRRIHFSVKGSGEIVSVGNADPLSLECFKDVESHSLYYGIAGLFIRRTGRGSVTLDAHADGLKSASFNFK